MYAKITKDHIDCTRELGHDFKREGVVIFGSLPLGTPVECRLYDDDDILYYEAEADDDKSLEFLHRWCAGDVGTTRLDVKRDGVWKTEIA